MDWTVDDVIDANPIEPGQSRSVLDRLLTTGQTNLDVLASAAIEIERRSRHYVASFFQLPFAVLVEPGWHRLKAHTLDDGMYAEFAFTPFELIYEDNGKMGLRHVPAAAQPKWPVITQVTALFPVWGIRARFHDKYLHHVEVGTKGNPTIVPQGPSWIDNRPISLGTYETNLARRLIREIQPCLRGFLPAYAITSLTEAPVPDWVYAYHAMPAPGRVVPAGPAVPVVKALVQQAAQALPPMQSFAPISRAMETKFRDFGRFEAQLFAMERLRLEGEIALSLIGGISLLEWVLKAIARTSGGAKFRGLSDVVGHPSITFFAPAEIELIDLARRARNALVHDQPPHRRSLTAGGASSHSQLPEGASHCSSGDVRSILELAFKAFREANRRGVAIAALRA